MKNLLFSFALVIALLFSVPLEMTVYASGKSESSSEEIKKLFAFFTGERERQENPDIYLFENTMDNIRVKKFDSSGKLLSQRDIAERPTTTPIVCNENGALYFASDSGIFSYHLEESKLSQIKTGSYGGLTVVGDKIYYCPQKGTSIDSCGLDGSNPETIVEDARLFYDRKEKLQDVSFLVSENFLFYVALNEKTNLPSEIKKYDRTCKKTETVHIERQNIQLLDVRGNKLIYQTVISPGIEGNTKTLYELDLPSKTAAAISAITSVAFNDQSIIYSDLDGKNVSYYSNGKISDILNIDASSIFIHDSGLYYASVSDVPYNRLEIKSNQNSMMPEGFYGKNLFVSQESKSMGNIIY